MFGKKVVSWHYALHAIEKNFLSRTASMHPPKNQILWCENFLNSSPKNWLTNWGIQKFFPWRPLKIEKKVFVKKVVSWHYVLHAIEKKFLSRTASTQPPKNQILWCKNFLSSSTKSGWHFFLAKNDDISRPYDLKNWVRIFSLVVLSSIYIGASYIKF